VGGLINFPDAISTVYPEAQIKLRILHMVGNTMKFISWKDNKKEKAISYR
jgi:putative transposase